MFSETLTNQPWNQLVLGKSINSFPGGKLVGKGDLQGSALKCDNHSDCPSSKMGQEDFNQNTVHVSN